MSFILKLDFRNFINWYFGPIGQLTLLIATDQQSCINYNSNSGNVYRCVHEHTLAHIMIEEIKIYPRRLYIDTYTE